MTGRTAAEAGTPSVGVRGRGKERGHVSARHVARPPDIHLSRGQVMGRGMASLATRLIALLVLHPTAAQRPPSCDAGSGLAHYRKYKMSYDHEADGQELLYKHE